MRREHYGRSRKTKRNLWLYEKETTKEFIMETASLPHNLTSLVSLDTQRTIHTSKQTGTITVRVTTRPAH